MARTPAQILTDAATVFINANVSEWEASEADQYIPLVVAAQLASLTSHGLHIVAIPSITPPKKG